MNKEMKKLKKLGAENEFNFFLSKDKEVSLLYMPGVFKPNTTSQLLIDAVTNRVHEKVATLDLGSGTGIVGLALHLEGLVKGSLCASDLSDLAVELTKKNLDRYECNHTVRKGSLFEPWEGHKFDLIVDDISGISSKIAEISPWFPGVPCDAGNDGADLISEIIVNAHKYLNKDGRLFFPVLSLSNVSRIKTQACKCFRVVEMVARIEWPLPSELLIYKPLLKELAANGDIQLEEKFGMVVCYTEVYSATEPI
jgi:16S rRNA G1207 methylase RsmC